jgi:hypothetical protein
MKIVAAVLGALIICFVLRDIFHTIFNPRGTGSIGDAIARATFKIFRVVSRIAAEFRPYSGPAAMLLVILTWAFSLILGWALVYWALIPSHVLFTSNVVAGREPRFLDALYASSLSLITLSSSEMTPTNAWARLLVPAEGLVGFGVFTASISWFLIVYPIMNRRRSFAKEVFDLRQIEEEEGRNLLASESNFSSSILHGLAQQLLVLRGDVLQFPITYFFQANDPTRDVPAILPYALRLAKRCQDEEALSVVIAGRTFELAIREYLRTLAPLMRKDPETETVDLIHRAQQDHEYPPRS